MMKHTYTDSRLNVSWKLETNKRLTLKTLKTNTKNLKLEPIIETFALDRLDPTV